MAYICENSQHTKSQPTLPRSGQNIFLHTTNKMKRTRKATYWCRFVAQKIISRDSRDTRATPYALIETYDAPEHLPALVEIVSNTLVISAQKCFPVKQQIKHTQTKTLKKDQHEIPGYYQLNLYFALKTSYKL